MDVNKSINDRIVKYREMYRAVTGGEGREELLRSLAKGGLVLVYTYLLASSKGLFDTFPFAVAFLSALPRNLGFATIGACLGAMFGWGFSPGMLVGYLLIFVLRTQVFHWITEGGTSGTEDPLVFRCILSASVALGVTVIPMWGDFRFYTLFGAFFMVFACPSMTLVFSGAFQQNGAGRIVRDAGWWLVRFCFVFSMKTISLLGFVPALAVATVLTVLSISERNAVVVCFTGFFAGLALGIQSAILLASLGLVGGVVYRYNRRLAPGAGLLAAVAYAFATMGLSASFSVLPDVVCGGLLAVPIWRVRGNPVSQVIPEASSAAMQYLDNEERQLQTRQEENTMESMQRLSQVFLSLGENRFPTREECDTLCQHRMTARCGGCKAAAYCRGEKETARKDAFAGASVALYKDGRVDGRFLLEIGCTYSAEIADELSLDYARLYRTKCEPQTADAYAAGFATISRLMIEQQEYRRLARLPRDEMSKTVSDKALRMGLSFSSVGVYGSLRKTVFFCDCKSMECKGGARGLQKMCEEVLGCRLTYPRIVTGAKGAMVVLESAVAYTLTHAEAHRCQHPQKICGDRVHSFTDGDNNPCLLLCDGMGSGAKAAIAAGIGCSLSESLSRAGATPLLITELLNTALRHRKSEDSCSFDLFSFDRYSGKGVFYKSGAAPTLVFRNGTVYKLSSKTAPLGVLQQTRPEQIQMQMQSGDLIIMASDGIAGDFEDAAALAAMVGGKEDYGLSVLCEQILEECEQRMRELPSSYKADDRSLCIIRIEGVDAKSE